MEAGVPLLPLYTFGEGQVGPPHAHATLGLGYGRVNQTQRSQPYP
jgi:hypothetical protein